MIVYIILIGVFIYISLSLFKRKMYVNEYVGFSVLIAAMVIDIVFSYPTYPGVYLFLIPACAIMMLYKYYQERKNVISTDTE